MTATILAFSINHQVEQIGAIAGLAAILGLAVLALLFFSQAREIKRLREWAGRAPERDAELQQRVTEEAARRASPPA
ncbi:MAG: LytR family transcriptional regulator, partial [Solirubrobacteraceae bacterium]|nr:LytR family transcriptional regulator [Solirubrobacteraceae bacterium]